MAVVQCTVDSEPPAELALARNGKVLATSNGIPGLAVETGHVQVARNALRLRVQAVPSLVLGHHQSCISLSEGIPPPPL